MNQKKRRELMTELESATHKAIETPLNVENLFREVNFGQQDPFQLLIAAIEIKERAWNRGGLKASEYVFRAITENFPDYQSAYYELAVALRYQGRLKDAIVSARRAHVLEPDHFDAGSLRALLLCVAGEEADAHAVLRMVKASTPEQEAYLTNIFHFAEYVKEFPPQIAQDIIADNKKKHAWLHHDQCAERISSAIKSRSPFALVRLGDGEGAYSKISEADEAKYAPYYKNIRRHWIDFLMGKDFDPTWTGYEGLTNSLLTFSQEADLIGLPYDTWVEYEYSIASPITVPCILNVNRWFNTNASPGLTLCNQNIHAIFQSTNALDKILPEAKGITVISCHDTAADVIRQKFGVEDVDSIKIPSESDAPHLGVKSSVNEHYPRHFWNIVDQLSQEHHGRVFIVAAGVFGKFYSIIIKRHGGIALDLGSMVDVWLKLASRGGYKEQFGL